MEDEIGQLYAYMTSNWLKHNRPISSFFSKHCGEKPRWGGNLFWNWWKKSDPRNSPWLKIPGRGMKTSSRTFIAILCRRRSETFFAKKSETRQTSVRCGVSLEGSRRIGEKMHFGRNYLVYLSFFSAATFCTFPVNQANNDGNTIYIRNNKFGRVRASQDTPW